MECLIKKTDDELQIVYGEVYAPNVPDIHGEFMTPVEVRKMAHRFLAKGIVEQVDTNHDNKTNGSVIVESFVAREDDTIFIPESWVIGMHVPSPEMWLKIKSGEMNGFSLEALVHLKPKVIEVEIPELVQGQTARKSGDLEHGHLHRFSVRFDEDGQFVGGQTSTDEAHFHLILNGTVTEPAGADEHTHRYSFAEQLEVVSERAA